MSTITEERPLRVVWSAQDADDVRERTTQKQRMAAFLTARDVINGAFRQAGSTIAQLLEKLHLGGAVRLARRACGWILGAFSLARKSLRTPGLLPGLGWLLSTTTGLRLVKAVGNVARSVVHTITKAAGKAVCWTLGLFGERGIRLAEHLQAMTTAVRTAVVTRISVITGLIWAFLPLKTVAGVVGAVCRERALRTLLGRFLSRRWSILARVVLNLALLPAFVRREVIRLMTGLLAAKPTSVQEPTPEDDPTPPVAAAKVVDLDAERAHRDLTQDDVLPTVQRQPTVRSQHAKRKR